MDRTTDAVSTSETAEAERLGEWDRLWHRRQQLIDRCEISMRYHRSRERFFDSLDRFTKFTSILTSSTALAAFQTEGWMIGALVTTAVLAALSLAFDFAARARDHAALAIDYGTLVAKAHLAGEQHFAEQLDAWISQAAAFEAREPAWLPVVQHWATFDYFRTTGGPQPGEEVALWKRLVGQLFPIQP